MPAKDDPLQQELRRLATEIDWAERPEYVESRWGIHPYDNGDVGECAWVRVWWPMGSDTNW